MVGHRPALHVMTASAAFMSSTAFFPGLRFFGPHRLDDNRDIKPLIECIQHRSKNADILREPSHIKAFHTIARQLGSKSGLVENRVLVLIEADTLGNLYHILRQVKVGMESCTVAVLKAVRRPRPVASLNSNLDNPVYKVNHVFSSTTRIAVD